MLVTFSLHKYREFDNEKSCVKCECIMLLNEIFFPQFAMIITDKGGARVFA